MDTQHDKPTNRGLSRRSFLAASAASGAALVAAGLVGCAPKSASTEEQSGVGDENTNYTISSTVDADMVIVGGGGGGLAAAAQAVDNNLNVVVLEKSETFGGTASYAKGIFAVGSQIQKDAGVTVTRQDLFTKCENYHHWLADPDVTMTLFKKSPETIQWIEDKGVKFTGVARTGSSEQTWHNPEGGVATVTTMLEQYARDHGAQLFNKTPAVKLVMDGDKVSGVVAKSGDKYIQYNAPVVLMSSGGFITSRDMVEKYTPFKFENFYNLGSEGRDGDGINMGVNVGAATHGMSAMMLAGGTIVSVTYDAQIRMGFGRSPILWLNQDGNRFADESTFSNFTYSGHIMCTQDKVFSIMDEKALTYFMQNGNAFSGAAMDKAKEEIDSYISQGADDIMTANTLDELAEKMGLDAATVKQTVDTYNSYCDGGLDLDFGKTDWLWKVEEPPFYAAELKTAVYTTVGGLKINGKAEVINTDGNVIPGLYACGGDAGGLYGDSYDVIICAGSQCGQTMNFGRIAADQAVEYIQA